MIRIQNIPLPIDGDSQMLRQKAASSLGVTPDELGEVTLARQSIDARKKTDVHYVCTLNVSAPDEAALVARAANGNVALFTPTPYVFPAVTRSSKLPVVVVGMGPAGLFSALYLARSGVPCILLERGRTVENRTEDVARFWRSGILAPSSNVQFGEGGAGTFSDGKLTTGTHDPRIGTVLDSLVAAGAPEDILYQQKPHIGTDVLRVVVRKLREELLSLGCEIRFEQQLTGIGVKNGALSSVTVTSASGPYELPCEELILAPGHSARDTFSMLFAAGVPMTAKAFAMGVRLEHSQAAMGLSQYGSAYESLAPADYKLACHLPNGRSAFTFCVCPGGEVVAAASDERQVVTNGMSNRARDGKNINGGLLVNVSPADFGSDHPLAGVSFQQHWEKAAFALGGSHYRAPVESVRDFLAQQAPKTLGAVVPTYRPGVTIADLSTCLPDFVSDTLRAALPLMNQKLRGFSSPEAVMTGVETRSSSPVRILRGDDCQSPIRGLYPCGEGAGYAGGIMSAAADGIRVAEAVAVR